ncbi:MAG: hypothetical protein L6R38_004823 [Xanthoria sp. 2 TBL-2021]|nr:MAG: hypothetical protein L6R38_004823 [Xanthoria sp. 2 TBL-2021]
MKASNARPDVLSKYRVVDKRDMHGVGTVNGNARATSMTMYRSDHKFSELEGPRDLPRLLTYKEGIWVNYQARPPGAAPTLVSLEDHYKLTLAGELEESNIALDRENPTTKAIASSLDVNDKLEPNRPVARGSAAAAGKRKMSLPGGKKVTTSAR